MLLGETKKNSRFPGPRAPKDPSPRFFLVDLIHASRVRTRFSCPQHSTDHASQKASVMPVFSTCTSKKNTWRSWEKPYLEEGVDILQGVDILWLLALNLCMQSSIKFSKKKRKNSPAHTNSRQWLPGNLEFFLVSPYLPCEQKVNTVLHLHRNWLRSWTGDITVFWVAVLANLLVEVLSTLVWEPSWRNDWWQNSGTEGWYVNPWLQDVNHAVPQGWGLRNGDLARWCGWEGELLVLGYVTHRNEALGHVFIPLIRLPWV